MYFLTIFLRKVRGATLRDLTSKCLPKSLILVTLKRVCHDSIPGQWNSYLICLPSLVSFCTSGSLMERNDLSGCTGWPAGLSDREGNNVATSTAETAAHPPCPAVASHTLLIPSEREPKVSHTSQLGSLTPIYHFPPCLWKWSQWALILPATKSIYWWDHILSFSTQLPHIALSPYTDQKEGWDACSETSPLALVPQFQYST